MSSCDPSLLPLSLEDRLSEAQEEFLTAHLSQCERCQRELEQLAGQPQIWLRVGAALKTTRAEHSEHPLLADRPHVDEVESAADFAVEFLSPSSDPESIGRLGDIEILEVIGHGGMGIVLKGFQPELKRLVAVKVLAPQLAVSAAARRRFAREAQATAAILHPNVMPILTVHSTGKLPYLVMPYVQCESLQQRIDRTGPLELVDILRIGMQTANGLAAAHAQGLVHRDVKPANILLEIGVERVMLTDFGLARAIDDASITRTGIIAGTPQYMSPEQARGEPVDSRSDLFSLGSVLYTLATGRPPFRAESTYAILRRLTDEPPRPLSEVAPQYPAWLGVLIHKLLEKQPSDRWSSSTEVAQLLEQCVAHVQQPAVFPLPEECQPIPLTRWRLSGSSIAITVVLAMLLAVGMIFLPQRISRSPIPDSASSITPAPPPTESGGRQPADAPTPPPDPTTEWNHGEESLAPLRQELDEWTRDAQQLWKTPK
ncbi:MAG: protein kinase [Planctomycetaceae bacterium]